MDLEEIRAKRMAELQAKAGAGQGAGAGSQKGEADAEKMAAAKERRATLLSQIMDNGARERLSRIAMVKQEKATQVEEMLLRMAQTGQLRQRLNETALVDLLGQIADASGSSAGKIQFKRRQEEDDDIFLQ